VWSVVRVEFRRALALRSEIRRAGWSTNMARPRPAKKPEPAPPAARRILPMELRVGDRLTDETAEWEVIGRPYTTNAGKNAHVRVKKVGQPDIIETRTCGAHKRVSVRRA